VLKIQVEVFQVVTLYSAAVGYKSFRGPCCLHLHGENEDEGDNGSNKVLQIVGVLPNITQCQNPEDPNLVYKCPNTDLIPGGRRHMYSEIHKFLLGTGNTSATSIKELFLPRCEIYINLSNALLGIMNVDSSVTGKLEVKLFASH